MQRIVQFRSLLTLVFLGISLSANAAEPDKDSELQWAKAPKFWDKVDAVLHDNPVFDWHGRHNKIQNEEQVKKCLDWTAKFRGVGLPVTAGMPLVKIFYDPDHPKEFEVAFLIADAPEHWEIFSNHWRTGEIPKKSGTRLEKLDFDRHLDALIEYAHKQFALTKEQGFPPALEEFSRVYLAHSDSMEFLLMAYFAAEHGKKDQAEQLIRASFHTSYDGDILKETFNQIAWDLFESGVVDLNEGAPRSEIAKTFRRIEREFPGGEYEEQAKEYADTLDKMASEDANFKAPGNINALPTSERVKSLVFQLRDCNAVQWSQPGHCTVIEHWGVFQNPELNAADRLVSEGFDAVPALLDQLNDTRLTRSYGYTRNFIPWRWVLQVRDAAMETLGYISGQGFYSPTSTSSYLSNETDDVRNEAIERAKKWWATAQKQGEAAWLREQLNDRVQDPQVFDIISQLFIRRLVKIEGNKALPDVKAWVKKYPNSGEIEYRLLLEVRDPNVEADMRERIRPSASSFDLIALSILRETKKISEQEYQDILYAGCELIVKDAPKKFNFQFGKALLDTGDTRSILLAAESLRNGWQTVNVMGLIKNPDVGWQVAPYLLPFLEDTAPDLGYNGTYEGKEDWCRVKDNAGNDLNNIIGQPLENFLDGTPPERDAAIEKLKAICAEKGIKPAFPLPKPAATDSKSDPTPKQAP